MKITLFCAFYALATFIIVPPLAIYFGRVAMPYDAENPYIRQGNFGYVLLNRHYVTPQLRTLTEGVAERLAKAYPNSVVEYLDCGFPFFDGFPLEPHMSHNDGRKIDISFFYIDNSTKLLTNQRPSWLGYGVCEEPKGGEEDRPTFCREKGFWEYNFMKRFIVPQSEKRNFTFDERRTRDLIRLFIADNHVKTVLIEPHLEKRLGFSNNNKVKTPPCESVRHDDHLHVAIY